MDARQAKVDGVRGFISLVIILGLLVLTLVVGGLYYLRTQPSIPPDALKPTVNLTPSPSPASGLRLNLAEIGTDKTVLTSPDNQQVATFYYKAGQQYEGDPTFSEVDVLDKATNQVTKYPLTGSITYAQGNLFWSPLNNRIYFTLAANGSGIYALWSSKIDGTDAKLISGQAEGAGYSDDLLNSPIYGAESVDYSFDGRVIVTARDLADNQHALWLMNADGTNYHPIPIIIPGNPYILKVRWQEDNSHIEVTTVSGELATTYLTDINGSILQKI